MFEKRASVESVIVHISEKGVVKNIETIKLLCPHCGNTWGVKPVDGYIFTRQLVCRECKKQINTE